MSSTRLAASMSPRLLSLRSSRSFWRKPGRPFVRRIDLIERGGAQVDVCERRVASISQELDGCADRRGSTAALWPSFVGLRNWLLRKNDQNTASAVQSGAPFNTMSAGDRPGGW